MSEGTFLRPRAEPLGTAGRGGGRAGGGGGSACGGRRAGHTESEESRNTEEGPKRGRGVGRAKRELCLTMGGRVTSSLLTAPPPSHPRATTATAGGKSKASRYPPPQRNAATYTHGTRAAHRTRAAAG
jgi:hypothetical protein